MLRPAISCSTFGVSERIRVPGPAARTRTAVSPRDDINAPQSGPPGRERAGLYTDTPLSVAFHARSRQTLEAPSPGLEPELSEPKSDVLPITPRRIARPRRL